jgi:redox-sensitive bicupin YhaK (pirin superfamily)
MMPPRYRDVKSDEIPLITLENGVQIKIICGRVNNVQGPVRDIMIDPEYLDITVPAHTDYEHPTKTGHTVFAYVIGGRGYFGMETDPLADNGTIILFTDGNTVHIKTGDDSIRFLLISGKPLDEPVAWHGPIVMNTQEELRLAFDEYQKGTFLKHRREGN